MEFGTFSFTIFWGSIKNVFRSPHTHTNNFSGGYKKVFRPPPKFIYFQAKHKKWILKADYFENKIGHGWWAIQKC